MAEICRRCGNEITDEEPPTLHKCSRCQNIKFDRDLLRPIRKRVEQNYQKLQSTNYKRFINGLHIFGSFLDCLSNCGDIDFLITYNEKELRKFIQKEIDLFHIRNEMIDEGADELSDSLESFLVNGFWQFQTCDEYPDCMDCFDDRGCKLPDDDYRSDFHRFCIEKCKKRNKKTHPDCLLLDCAFLERSIRDQITKDVHKALTDGGLEYISVAPDLKIKVVDFVMKESISELKKEFDSMKTEKTLKIIQIF